MRWFVGLLIVIAGTVFASTSCDGSGSFGTDFERRAAAAREFHGRADYEVTTNGGDAGESAHASMRLYQRGVADEFRIDFNGAGSPGTIIESPPNEFACSENAAALMRTAAIPGPTCLKRVPGEGTDAGNWALVFSLALAPVLTSKGAGVVDVSGHWTDEIIGQDVDCYGIRHLGYSGSYCFSEASQLLAARMSAGGSIVDFRATATGRVSDADFEPPYPIVDSN